MHPFPSDPGSATPPGRDPQSSAQPGPPRRAEGGGADHPTPASIDRRRVEHHLGAVQSRPPREPSAAGLRVGLFFTCLVDLMRPNVGFASARLLEDAGCQVEVPDSQTCCGQPAFNAGDNRTARDLAVHWIEAFERFDYVVVPSGSCAGMIRAHYPQLVATDPDLRSRMLDACERTWELTSFLVDVCGMHKPPGDYRGAMTYHDSCSGLRELGVRDQPRELLRAMPHLALHEMGDARACCGFGGTFAVKYGDVSAAIADEKIAQIAATGAPCVAMGDVGCMLHLEGRLRRLGDATTQVMHVAEVLVHEAGDA